MTELYEKSLRKLELDNVLAQLADCANSEDGKDRCRALLPLDDAEEIRLLQQQTTAACGMIVRKGAPGFHELKPVAASLERADRGGCLTPVELLRIAGVLRCIRNVKAYYSEDGEPTVLDVYFQELSPNRYLSSWAALTQGKATIAYPMFAYRPKKNAPSAFTASGGEPI